MVKYLLDNGAEWTSDAFAAAKANGYTVSVAVDLESAPTEQ
jgi:hypothetical protein